MKLSKTELQITIPVGTLVQGRPLGSNDHGELIRVTADCQIDDARRMDDGAYYYRLGRMEYIVSAGCVRRQDQPLSSSGIVHPNGLVALVGASS